MTSAQRERILVTGGAGYIGSVVAERLQERGYIPVVFDNLSQGHREAVPAGVELVPGDLADAGSIREVLHTRRIEAVIHLAASAIVHESMTNPAKYYQNNVANGITLLEAMRECGVERIVFSSSGTVYGNTDVCPITEDSPPQPINPYGKSKLAFEKMLHWYAQAYGLTFTVLRYFNAAGATLRLGEHHDPETRIIPIALKCALGQRLEVEVNGDDYPTADGTCIRDYIHVLDLAEAHILALSGMNSSGRIYNLGNGNGFSVREVVETARQITGHPIPAKIKPQRPGDPASLVASSSLIAGELGWAPRYRELDEIIDSAWRWHRSHPHGYAA